MSIEIFINELFSSGNVTVPAYKLEVDGIERVEGVLVKYDRLCRMEFPGVAPALHVEAAIWAAKVFYRACQFAIYREIPPEAFSEELVIADWVARPDASAHYSVDFVFQFLPDLFRRSKTASADDPLLAYFSDWARHWPLSSVGIKEVDGPFRLEAIVSHPGLFQCYCDRIIKHTHIERLEHSAVRKRVLANLGTYSELAPAIYAALDIKEAVTDDE